MAEGNKMSPEKIGTGLMLAGAAYLGYQMLVKPAIDKGKVQELENNAGSNPSTAQAQALISALDPTYTFFNSTNRTGVFNVAAQISDINAVIAAYGTLSSGRSLDADLRKSLSDQDYRAFYNQV